MPRILLTGGSGFIAAHVLDTLLQRGHSVVTTVRSPEKAQRIRDAHPGVPPSTLDFAIVPDIAQPNAFDKAVVSEPPFDIVIHTASPFHFRATDVEEELLKPAINGTVGILHAIKKHAPTVTRVVITSSFAAIIDVNKPASYDDWNPIKREEAASNARTGYRASKTFAEKAAWDFIEKEKPNFTLATCNPPLVSGPVVHYLASLDAINTSNERICQLASGPGDAMAARWPADEGTLWVDVRDIALAHALAHALAAEKPAAANQRFFIVAGNFSNAEIVRCIADGVPALRARLPRGREWEEGAGDGQSEVKGAFGFDNRKSREVLGLTYRTFRESVVDTVQSVLPLLD
ncbi:Glycine-rich RNA-binding protein 2, mitochondrial [Ophidiomyces ophidiicola]|nr:Glycine-rich RNA-binding protein 2, mitochondrial [Ophidiomyces ophidiicola]